MKLSEEARADLLKWYFDMEVVTRAEAKTQPKVEVKEEKKQETR